MGLSGFSGRVYYINNSCPVVNASTLAVAVPAGNAVTWVDEVTKFTVVDSVQKKEYGHDKSAGWQDVCAGIRKLSITLDVNVKSSDFSTGVEPSSVNAGKVLFLELYPAGSSISSPMKGYAMVDQISYTFDQETGLPISYTMTLSSKLAWAGLGDSAVWGGEECNGSTGV